MSFFLCGVVIKRTGGGIIVNKSRNTTNGGGGGLLSTVSALIHHTSTRSITTSNNRPSVWSITQSIHLVPVLSTTASLWSQQLFIAPPTSTRTITTTRKRQGWNNKSSGGSSRIDSSTSTQRRLFEVDDQGRRIRKSTSSSTRRGNDDNSNNNNNNNKDDDDDNRSSSSSFSSAGGMGRRGPSSRFGGVNTRTMYDPSWNNKNNANEQQGRRQGVDSWNNDDNKNNSKRPASYQNKFSSSSRQPYSSRGTTTTGSSTSTGSTRRNSFAGGGNNQERSSDRSSSSSTNRFASFQGNRRYDSRTDSNNGGGTPYSARTGYVGRTKSDGGYKPYSKQGGNDMSNNNANNDEEWGDKPIRSSSSNTYRTDTSSRGSSPYYSDRTRNSGSNSNSWGRMDANDGRRSMPGSFRSQRDTYPTTNSRTSPYKYEGGGGGATLEEGRINLRAFEEAGFVHLYGIAPVLNALQAGKRKYLQSSDKESSTKNKVDENDDGVDDEEEEEEEEVDEQAMKPEAQLKACLFVQEQKGPTTRSADKASQTERVLRLAKSRKIPVSYVDKGVLNTLSGNRPHQGYVLRCGMLMLETITKIIHTKDDPTVPRFWLVLDEVVDPQNLGALLRSVMFLGGMESMGVLVCAKNSAPPSPVVSAASAGALELMNLYSTNNLPKTLAMAEQDGFRIVGATSTPSTTDKEMTNPIYDLPDLPTLIDSQQQPTLLVLGSEGHGLRKIVSISCTEFVRIPGSSSAQGVDSLNVSVTGGILLWHFLQHMMKSIPTPSISTDIQMDE